MIISPPLLKTRESRETDAAWIERVMAEDPLRGFPVNRAGSWHGGIHIRHTDSRGVEKVRAIADGTVVSFRPPSGDAKRDQAPLNLNADNPGVKGSDDGYVLLRHETETGSGDDAKVVFYSLYMHLKSLRDSVKSGTRIYRKEAMGTPGMADAVNAIHFQIFCDDDNISKLTGRKTRELDVSTNGRTDAVYGDIHFYLPAGTKFYSHAPKGNALSVTGLAEVHTSTVPLYVSMTLEKGSCTMVTRQQNAGTDGVYIPVGEALVDADGEDYEYNLYKTAMRNYKESPSAGFELLRFGRVINTEHETLVPADAPLWMTVNYPGGKGVVNLADATITKFSDADFPHWTGWQLIDDDTDTNSQCNSTAIQKWQEEGQFAPLRSRLICHFPLEWEKSTVDARFSWLKSGSDGHDPMSDEDYNKFKAHSEALCFDTGALGKGRLWHFNPAEFIRHFRKCGWLSHAELSSLLPRFYYAGYPATPQRASISWETSIKRWEPYVADFNRMCNKYNILGEHRKAAFIGQVYIETAMMRTVNEIGRGRKNKKGKWPAPAMEYYQAFYGRGFMQLTWPSNYEGYLNFRTKEKLPELIVGAYDDSRITSNSLHYWADPRKVEKDKKTGKKKIVINNKLLRSWFPRYDPKIISDDPFNAVDSAGYYWVSKHHDGVININRVSDRGISSDSIGRCSVLVNGGGYGYFERQGFSRFVFYYLNDAVRDSEVETVSVRKGTRTVNVTINYKRQGK
jgi:predicted chitinase